MDIKKGRRKSFDIEYVIVTEDNIGEVAEWSGGIKSGEGKDAFVRLVDKGAINAVQTKAFIGDVVVHHMELNTYKKFGRKAFNKSYEEVSDLPRTKLLTDSELEADKNAIDAEQEIRQSAVTGRFVSEKYAKEHPFTTFTQKGTGHKATVSNDELPKDADPS